MLSLISALLLQSAFPAAAGMPAKAVDCRYDRAAMLRLDLTKFDQDMTGGWRALADRGCDAQAADLIRDWRTANPVEPQHASTLLWHEGQLRANAGQTTAAIALFEQSRKPPERDVFGWNLYVDGSIAFLRRDRSALDTARNRLVVLPKPEGLTVLGPDGKPSTVRWPRNLNVLDALQRCWGQPYRIAYACPPPR